MRVVICLAVLSGFMVWGCDTVVYNDSSQPQPVVRSLDASKPETGLTFATAHHTITITEANFEEQVVNSSQTVLVDFWAPWCATCLEIAPQLEEIAAEYQGRAVVGKLNVDDNPELARKFAINTIPALLVFKGGRQVGKIVGAESKARIVAELKKGL